MRSLAVVVASLGVSLAAYTAVKPADAFCGFYVSDVDTKLYADATQVVLMRDGTKTVLSMQNDYKGPPEKFAMVVPVPVVLAKENVKTLPMDVFETIDKLGSPRLVEYWEQDPCPDPSRGNMWGDTIGDAFGAGGLGLSGIGEGGGGAGLGVKVEAKFAIGEYEIVILSAKDAAGLDTWLKQEKYNIPAGAEPYLKPYVQAGMKFFVAKVDITKVKMENGHALLSPIRFHFDSEQFNLPIKLGLINSAGTQDLIVNILAKNQRYEVANYPNVTIPTNLDVTEAARSKFPEFYAALFDKTVEANISRGDKKNPVVTEYSWSSGSCDPCPGPTLSGDDLATFGADVIPNGLEGVYGLGSGGGGGIGLGNIGTLGSGGTSGARSPKLRAGALQVNGRLPPEVISRIVRQNFGRYRLCYENGLTKNPKLSGQVSVKFIIDRSGAVSSAQDANSDLPDAAVVSCIVRGFQNLSFPQPEGGVVTVVFPIQLSPPEGAPATSAGPPPPPPPPRPAPAVFNGASPYVMTRLHVRYSKDSMGEDLIFKKAGPIVGGREDYSGPDRQLEKGAKPSDANNFQARYAVRHAWTGPIECKEPMRNRWGRKPLPKAPAEGGAAPPEKPDPDALKGVLGAPKLAFAPRGGVSLGQMLTPGAIADVSKAGVTVEPAPAAPAPSASASTPPKSDADGGIAPSEKKGCGCSMIDPNAGAASLGFGGVILGLLRLRRRRRG